ncbi:LLM class flavin-dependent oxidoreductase [Micromonospora sp. NPDC005206]|uniref:LLM class flavin-dependent oxidoreductase n=1 Tax=Micromonospora sp. NPDC005206 TaxID=3157022 RepID=UPI0033B8EFE3
MKSRCQLGGGGIGRPLKLINEPLRADIPIHLAAIGPRNVELAAELFDGWQPLLFDPDGAHAAFGRALTTGLAKRDPSLAPLQIVVDTHLLITQDPDELEKARRSVRSYLALYIGGMGPRDGNYYTRLVSQFGYPDEADRVQELYLSGQRQLAADTVSNRLVNGLSLIGDPEQIGSRLEALRGAGVTGLALRPLAPTPQRRIADIAALRGMRG